MCVSVRATVWGHLGYVDRECSWDTSLGSTEDSQVRAVTSLCDDTCAVCG